MVQPPPAASRCGPGWVASQAVSLVEVMIAVAILAVALLAILGVFIGGLELMAHSQEATVGHEIARAMLEEISAADRSTLPTANSTFDGTVPTGQTLAGFPPAPYPEVVIDGRRYIISVQTRQVVGTTVSVAVEVSWGQPGGAKLETYLHP